MKKLQLLAYAGAIALLSTGFTACSDDNLAKEEVVTPGSNYDPATNKVNVDFVFNVSLNNNTTRMTNEAVQADIMTNSNIKFRGIDNASMFAFTLKNGSTYLDDRNITHAVAEADIPPHEYFDLGTVAGSEYFQPASSSGTKSKRILELSLPVETNALMFYGKAIKGTTSDGSEDAKFGKVQFHIDKNANIANTRISLQKVVDPTTTQKDKLQQYQRLLAAVLTETINTSLSISSGSPVVYGDESWSGTIKWSDYVQINISTTVNGDGTYDLVPTDGTTAGITAKEKDPVNTSNNMSNLGKILANAFVTSNTIYPNELRAGSGPAILRMARDLSSVIWKVASSTPINLEEAVAKQLAQTIFTKLQTIFDIEKSSDVVTSCGWAPMSQIKASTIVSSNSLAVNYIADTESMNEFPSGIFHLPWGATVLEIKSKDGKLTYRYQGTVPTYAMGETNSGFNPDNYVYPAELCYFGNAPLRASKDQMTASDYPDGAVNWMAQSSWDSQKWTSTHVLSNTRSVAMKNNIYYAVGLLKSVVKYGTGVLKDNNAAIQAARNNGATELDKTIDVSSGVKFRLTGVLIGGQNGEVGWNFVPVEQDPGFGYMVYDNQFEGTGGSTVTDLAIPYYGGSATGTNPCYTLLFDNWDHRQHDKVGGPESQHPVYVALEFKNESGEDFWGQNNLIPKDGYFYITGKLDPDAPVGAKEPSESMQEYLAKGISWPTNVKNNFIPPYYYYDNAADEANADEDKKSGMTIKERRVFMQDFVTEATFVLTENSLKHALVAVPDLRSTQLSLGLSVDLSWKTGLQFTNVPLDGGQ